METIEHTPRSESSAETTPPEQLSLLGGPSRAPAKARFRLGRATCERGLRHVAEIKQQLAARQREKVPSGTTRTRTSDSR